MNARTAEKRFVNYKSTCDHCNNHLSGGSRDAPKVRGYLTELDGVPVLFTGECCDFDGVHEAFMTRLVEDNLLQRQVSSRQSRAW